MTHQARSQANKGLLPTEKKRWPFYKRLQFLLYVLYRPTAYVFSYAVWVLSIRLLTLTFITYLIYSPTSQFQDISDAFSSNEVTLMGLSALLYMALLYGFNPLTAMPLSEIITRKQIEKGFLPGFVEGAVFAGGMILAFILSGIYRYLGYYIQFDEAPLELINVLCSMAALVMLSYCEEYFFRHKLAHYFQKSIPKWVSIQVIAVFYCGIKLLQFDLGIMHVITLYLASVALSYRAAADQPFARGAGFWAAILILFHPLLSLPIFGNNFSGILLVKYLDTKNSLAAQNPEGMLYTYPWHIWPISHIWHIWPRILSGGLGGPLSSLAFQTLLILDVGRSIIRQKTPKT